MNGLAWLGTFHGFLLVDKPAGMTSQDVITRFQNALVERSRSAGSAAPPLRKRDLPSMGHGGTLDPFATGLLVVAVGDGVKLTRYLLGSDKSYEAEVAFGTRTASGDLTNEVVDRTERLPRDESELARAAASFLGKPYPQTPPMYSAKKIEGVPLYALARKGVEVERAAIACRVEDLEILSARRAANGIVSARIRTTVSSGTFVRTLAEDLAARIGSLAHLTALRRLSSGALTLADALPLEGFASALAGDRPWSALPCFIPFHRAILGILPRMEIDEETAARIFAGEVRALARLELSSVGPIALYARDRLVAVVRDGDAATGAPRAIERGFPLRFRDDR